MKDFKQQISYYPNHIAVIANGEFPSTKIIVEKIFQSKVSIACDAAIKNLLLHNIIPDYVIGDGDSVKEEHFAKYPYILEPDQNTNDLTKAINFIEKTFGKNNSIIVYAATGLREDHTISNIALLVQYTSRFKHIIMLSDYGVFNVSLKGSITLPTLIGQQVSLFSLSSKTIITSYNLKWELNKYTLKYLNSGSLNQAIANSITLISNKPIIIYRAFEIK